MHQFAPVVSQSTQLTFSPRTSSGTGQAGSSESSRFAAHLFGAGQAASGKLSGQSGPSTSNAAPNTRLADRILALASLDQCTDQQLVNALKGLLADAPQTQKALEDALQAESLSGFLTELLGPLEQQPGDSEGQKGRGLEATLALAELLARDPGLEKADSRTDPELNRLLEGLQSLLGNEQRQAQDTRTDVRSWELIRSEAGQQVQNRSGGSAVGSEMSPELRQVLRHLQAVLDGREGGKQGGKPQAAAGNKLGMPSQGQEQGTGSQARLQSQSILSASSQPPVQSRGQAYYLQPYQNSDQAQAEAAARTEAAAQPADGRSAGEGKSGLSGQGRGLLAEAMLQQTSAGSKGQTGAGSGAQFNLAMSNAADGGPGGGTGNAAGSFANAGTSGSSASVGQGFAAQASGSQHLFEQSMVDQVRFRLSQGMRAGQQEVVVRMHPRELGEVRLSLTSEDGNLRAHLHVQSQQVQDVLERNMPRLREALAEQGIEVDDFMFSSDEQGRDAEYRTFAQEEWRGGRPSETGDHGPEPTEMHAGREQAGYTPEQGLSVRI